MALPSAMDMRGQAGVRLWRRARPEHNGNESEPGDIPHRERTVQRNGTTYTLHLPASQRQAQPQCLRAAPTIAQALVIRGGLTPTGTHRLLKRLEALALDLRRDGLRVVPPAC